MDEEQIRQALAEKVVDGQITCEDCLAVAKGLGIPPTGFAQILTDMNVKIVQCQLSCFP